MSEPNYLITGTALELIRWIMTSPKALELEFEHVGLFVMDKYKGKVTHNGIKRGYIVGIHKILVANFLLYANSKGRPLGIALL